MFSHAITQDVVYHLMLGAHRRAFHLSIGEWIERQTAADPRLPVPHAVLARHFRLADVPERAALHLEAAGQQALDTHSNIEAVRFFSELVELAPRLGAVDPLRRARWEQSLGQALLNLGHIDRARTHITAALTLLKSPFPNTTLAMGLALLGQVLRQAGLRLLPAFAKPRPRGTEGVLTDACVTLISVAYLDNRAPDVVLSALMALNLAEAGQVTRHRAGCYAFMAVVWGGAGLHRVARWYEQKGMDDAAGDDRLLAAVLNCRAMYLMGRGDFDATVEVSQRAMALFTRLNDHRSWESCGTGLGYIPVLRGDFAGGLELYRQIHLSGQRRNDAQTTGWGLNGMAMCLLPMGRLEEALACLDRSRPSINEELSRIACLGLEALIHLRAGRVHRAHALAKETAERLSRSSLASYATFKDYAAVAEVYLHLCRVASPGELPPLLKMLRQTCRALRKRSGIYPIGAAQGWLRTGELQAFEGTLGAARKSWDRAMAAALVSGSPYEQGLVWIERGRHAQGEARAEHLERAIQLLEPIKAAWDVERARALLPSSSR